jgi:hypothetical protein
VIEGIASCLAPCWCIGSEQITPGQCSTLRLVLTVFDAIKRCAAGVTGTFIEYRIQLPM